MTDYRKVRYTNKHACKGSIEYYNQDEIKEIKVRVPFSRLLSWSDRQLPYRSRNKDQLRLTLHHGQRKLLLSEIEFLTKYGDRSKNVIYVGAAPGQHTPFLSELFPKHKFYLFDPAVFAIEESSKIKIYNEFFDDQAAKKLKKRFKTKLMICDVRSGSQIEDDKMEKEFEACVLRDLEAQKRWHEIIQPEKSMLKFRLPYTVENFDYLDGDIFYQAWAPLNSAETRLYVDKEAGNRVYTQKEYEDIMYRFNVATRQQTYDLAREIVSHPKKPKGFDGCYDCTSEVYIIGKYLDSMDPGRIIDFMEKITKECNQRLDRMCHGLVGPMPTWQRLQSVSRRI